MTLYHVSELLDVDQLDRDIANGMIKTSEHPTLPLTIYCYSHMTQFKQYWTRETKTCRGLILDDEGFVIARGPAKFFNYGQSGSPSFSLDDTCIVTDKLDGSLGIGWRYLGQQGIATKGSFTSPQAIKATEMLSHDLFDLDGAETEIFEIIYPEGRIVLDYGAKEELHPLGTVINHNGTIIDRDTSDSLVLHYNLTVRDALSLPPRPNAEGLVLDIFTVSGLIHVKVKQDDYKRLHAIVTNTSERTLWMYLVAERFKDDIKQPKHWGSIFHYSVPEFVSAVEEGPNWRDRLFDTVPDEFEEWVHRTIDRLETEAGFAAEMAIRKAEKCIGLDKYSQFLELKDEPYVTEMLRYLQKGDVTGIHMRAWAEVQPRGICRPFSVEEE